MITFLYPKDDWTAAEIVMKIQALAASQGYNVYSTPKNTKRNIDEINMKLSKTEYAIFMAVDVNKIDEDTQTELEILSKTAKRICYLVPYGFKLKNIKRNNIYRFKHDKEKPANALILPALLLFLLLKCAFKYKIKLSFF